MLVSNLDTGRRHKDKWAGVVVEHNCLEKQPFNGKDSIFPI